MDGRGEGFEDGILREYGDDEDGDEDEVQPDI
jgi:hypothetical protein